MLIDRNCTVSDAVLQYLLAGLQQPALASASATSLQAISMQCKNQMINHFQGLVQIVQVMDTLSLSTEAAINLIKGNLPGCICASSCCMWFVELSTYCVGFSISCGNLLICLKMTLSLFHRLILDAFERFLKYLL